jgi:general secretion pathway protein K
MNSPRMHPQQGAALLLALLTVALVASISTAAYWQQWQGWSAERAERQRAQTAWLLTGSLDWARLILREDARASSVDHLAEPWAVPLQEARISSFIAQAADSDPTTDAFLSGSIRDMQGRLNWRNLVVGEGAQAQISAPDVQAFTRLYNLLGLPATELQTAAERLQAALGNTTKVVPAPVLPPSRYDQLAWLGLSKRSLSLLAPHSTWLPERTPLNINTAGAQALYATIPGLNLAQAQNWTEQRSRQYANTLADANQQWPSNVQPLNTERHSTTSRYFEVVGQLRLDDAVVQETSLLVRNGIQVRVVWRQRQSQRLTDANAF